MAVLPHQPRELAVTFDPICNQTDNQSNFISFHPLPSLTVLHVDVGGVPARIFTLQDRPEDVLVKRRQVIVVQ